MKVRKSRAPMLDWSQLQARNKELLARPRGDKGLVERVERTVAADPAAAITFDAAGRARVHAEGRAFDAGIFTTPSVRELRAQARPGTHRAQLSVVVGGDPITDIGFLQSAAPAGTTFQVASQFNCLEAPDEMVVPVHRYLKDPTQGPRAAVSAFPGALLRHYAAPAADGTRFVQTEALQLNLLADALPEALGRVQCGYLMAQNLPSLAAAADALEQNLESIRVGVNREVEVVLGANWDGAVTPGQRVTQVLTSTFAGGGYSGEARIEGDVWRICQSLLRAAYLGTLVASEKTVVLTMIGGGVFGNPHALIFDSLLWALDQRGPSEPLEVVLNARQLDETITEDWVAEEVGKRGGTFFRAAGGTITPV